MTAAVPQSTPWLQALLGSYPTLERAVITAEALAPTLWILDKQGWQVVGEASTITPIIDSVRAEFTSDDEVALTSAGIVQRVRAIDGVGQITVRYVRGPSAHVIVSITPIDHEGNLSVWGIDENVTDALEKTPRGLVLVGGLTELASHAARALFTDVTSRVTEAPAGVIAAKPIARSIARTPWLWLFCDSRRGVTRVEDAAETLVDSGAKVVLIQAPSNHGLVEAATLLVDSGALVIAQVPGENVQSMLERWRVAIPQMEQSTWTSTVASLRLAVAIDQVAGRFKEEIVAEWLSIDGAERTTLAREGPAGAGALLGMAGMHSRESAIAALRSKGLVA